MTRLALSVLASRSAVIAATILTVVCVVIYLAMLALAWFSHPSFADDYCYATKFIEMGIIGGTVDHYMGWSGGYSSIFLSGAIPVLFDYISIYKYIPMVLILMTALVATHWVIAVCNSRRGEITPWIMGVGFVVLFLSMMPSVVTGFYWFNAAMTYQVANIFLTLMVALVISLISGDKNAKTGRRFLLLGIAIVIGMGCTETVMSAIFIFANCVCIWRLSVMDRNRRYWVAILFVTYAAFLVVVLAPGNSVRAGVSSNAFLLLPSLKNSVRYGWDMLLAYLAMPQLWCGTIVASILFCRLGWSRNSMASIKCTHVAAAIMVTLSIPVVLGFPSWLALGIAPPLRTQNAILYIFLIAWFSSVALLSFKYLGRAGPVLAVQPLDTRAACVKMVACLAMGIALWSSSNVRLVTSDLIVEARDYDQFMEHRYELMRAAQASGLDTAVVPGLENWPLSLDYLEIHGSSVEEPFLRCFADYFGVPDVIVESP